MSFSPTAILTAIEEVCLGTIGSVETVTANAVLRGAYQSATDETWAALARVKPRVEVEWLGASDSGLTPRLSSHKSLSIKVLIRVLYATEFEVDAALRKTLRASAAALVEQIRSAVTRPGNLTQTSGAVLTELASGCLFKSSSSVKREDFKRRIYATEITCEGLVCTTRP